MTAGPDSDRCQCTNRQTVLLSRPGMVVFASNLTEGTNELVYVPFIWLSEEYYMAQMLVAVIGAGGKTTALTNMGQECAEKSVLLTTTTHIFPMNTSQCKVCLTDPSANALSAALSGPGIVCAGSASSEGKLALLPQNVLKQGIISADIVLYEGDGAHGRPLKLHREDEPVFLPGTDRCLILAGLSSLGQTVRDAVHRYERNSFWKNNPEHFVSPDDIVYCVMEAVNASKLPYNRLRVFLNQEDKVCTPELTSAIMLQLEHQGLNVRSGSLKNLSVPLYKWVTEERFL